MDEKRLVLLLKQGDINAFDSLVEQYSQRIYNLSLSLMCNSQDAEDATQDTFIRIYKAIGGFKGNSSLSTWIYSVTRNVCLDALRKRKRNNAVSVDFPTSLEDSEVAIQIPDENANTEETVLKNERYAVLNEILKKLSPDHREMIVFRDIKGLSYEEIAAITRNSLGTVKSRINRARQQMRKLLSSETELFEEYYCQNNREEGVLQ